MSETAVSKAPSGLEILPSARRGRRKQVTFRLLALAAAVAAAVLGVRYYLHARLHESTDDAFVEGHVIPVSPRVAGHVLRVHIRDNQQVQGGDLLVELDPRDFEVRLQQARASLRVAEARQKAADVSADLTQVTSMAGMDEATAGVSRSRSGVESARAQVAAARSRVAQIRAQRATAEANSEQAAADVFAWEAEATRAEADLKRYEDAIQTRGVSRQQLDQAAATARTAAARLEAARKKAIAAKAQVGEVQAAEQTATDSLRQAVSQVSEAEAQVGQSLGRQASARGAPKQIAVSRSQAEASAAEIDLAREKVKQAELELSYTKLTAPETGRIARRVVEPGAFVQVGQPLLALVSKAVWVVANFKESQIADMRPGQAVQVRVDAYPGLVLKGRVDSMQPGTGSRFSLLPAENATGNFVKVVQRLPVKIVFDEEPPADRPLAPGMSVVPEVRVR